MDKRLSLDTLPDWLTVNDVQAVLGLGRSTAYELIKSGTIPSRKFGRLLRVPREALRWGPDDMPYKKQVAE